jgi:hypothetical protein
MMDVSHPTTKSNFEELILNYNLILNSTLSDEMSAILKTQSLTT